MAHYDWLQAYQYFNQSLVNFAINPSLEIARFVLPL